MIVALVIVILTANVVNGENLIYVGGGKTTWAPNINFTDWSSHEKFYVGDWLYFGFDKNLYNVLEVNKTSYDNCNDAGFIKNITRGGRDVFQLTEAKTYYFICGRGYCYGGMKVAVNVEDIPPTPSPTPTPAQDKSAAPSKFCSWNPVLVALLIALPWIFLWNFSYSICVEI